MILLSPSGIRRQSWRQPAISAFLNASSEECCNCFEWDVGVVDMVGDVGLQIRQRV